MIDSIAKMDSNGVNIWTWEEMPDSVRADIELALILKEC